MSGRRRAKLSPSLFPFLAVLVCTLGTLILLLALVAKDATEQTVAKAAQTAQQKIAEQTNAAPDHTAATDPTEPPEGHPGFTATQVDHLIEDQQFRLTQLVSFRDSQTADVENRRDQIAHLESHIAKLSDELKQLNTEIENTLANDSPDKQAANQQTVTILLEKIESETKRIEELKATTGNAEPRVVIVPHKGPNGTARRPIYLECDADRLTIHPEGVEISIDQLRGSSVGANPLDSALRVIRGHATRVYGDTDPPYPLLVVRPAGIRTYRAARGALRDFDDQFGYELVSEELDLALPEGDENLRRRTEQVIAEAVSNQALRQQIIASRRRQALSSQPRAERFPVLSASDLSRRGTQAVRSPAPVGNGGWSPLPNEAVSSARSYAQQRETHLQGSPLAGSVGELGRSSRSSRSSRASESSPSQRSLSSSSPEAGPTGRYSFELPGQTGGRDAKDFTGDQSYAGLDATADLAPSRQSLSHNPSGRSGRDSNEQHGSGSTVGTTANTGPSNSSTFDQNSSSQQSDNGSANIGDQTATDSGSNQSPDQNASQSPPSNSQPSNSYSRRSTDSLAQPGTPGWGLPGGLTGARGSSIVRIITAEAHADRLVLWPSRGGGTETFGVFDNNARRTLLELATAVRDRIDQWGAALPGAHWQPTLEIIVRPGGEELFGRLQRLMRDSGVDVIAKQTPPTRISETALPSPALKR